MKNVPWILTSFLLLPLSLQLAASSKEGKGTKEEPSTLVQAPTTPEGYQAINAEKLKRFGEFIRNLKSCEISGTVVMEGREDLGPDALEFSWEKTPEGTTRETIRQYGRLSHKVLGLDLCTLEDTSFRKTVKFFGDRAYEAESFKELFALAEIPEPPIQLILELLLGSLPENSAEYHPTFSPYGLLEGFTFQQEEGKTWKIRYERATGSVENGFSYIKLIPEQIVITGPEGDTIRLKDLKPRFNSDEAKAFLFYVLPNQEKS